MPTHTKEELARIDAVNGNALRASLKELNTQRDEKAAVKKDKEQAVTDKKAALASLRTLHGIERAQVHANHQQELLELRLRHDTEKLQLQNS